MLSSFGWLGLLLSMQHSAVQSDARSWVERWVNKSSSVCMAATELHDGHAARPQTELHDGCSERTETELHDGCLDRTGTELQMTTLAADFEVHPTRRGPRPYRYPFITARLFMEEIRNTTTLLTLHLRYAIQL